MNEQKPEPRRKGDGSTLEVNSIFPTIQGEGPFTGTPAIFIRLAGCNLQCPGCDTEYTERKEMSIDNIVDKMFTIVLDEKHNSLRLVVITGGEPFRQNIWPLIDKLRRLGYRVQIETNGSMPLPKSFPRFIANNVTIVCSPKTTKLHPSVLPMINAYKYVLNYSDQNKEDGLPNTALDHKASPFVARPHDGFSGRVYLQPMDMDEHYGVNEATNRNKKGARKVKSNFHNSKNRDACIEACMKFGYILQLQLHKIIGLK